MRQSPVTFVVAKKNIKNPGGTFVEEDDVGIRKPETGAVFFIRVWKKVMADKRSVGIFDVTKTGDAFAKKICNICHKLLNATEFAKNQNAKNNMSVRRPSCRSCRKHLEGIDVTPKEKSKWQANKPNNEPFQCPICSKRTIAGVTSKVVLEHDHRSGKVRGWVCDSCNTGIGRFKDDTELLKRAIRFIEKDIT